MCASESALDGGAGTGGTHQELIPTISKPKWGNISRPQPVESLKKPRIHTHTERERGSQRVRERASANFTADASNPNLEIASLFPKSWTRNPKPAENPCSPAWCDMGAHGCSRNARGALCWADCHACFWCRHGLLRRKGPALLRDDYPRCFQDKWRYRKAGARLTLNLTFVEPWTLNPKPYCKAGARLTLDLTLMERRIVKHQIIEILHVHASSPPLVAQNINPKP